MASLTMTASFLGGSVATMSRHPSTVNTRRGVAMAKATRVVEVDEKSIKEEANNTRRDLMFAAAAAAASSIAKAAMAEEPKNGSEEAKKKYAPICVAMPTARVCRN